MSYNRVYIFLLFLSSRETLFLRDEVSAPLVVLRMWGPHKNLEDLDSPLEMGEGTEVPRSGLLFHFPSLAT